MVHSDLGSMDMLIELNDKRLKILEQARKLRTGKGGAKVSQQFDSAGMAVFKGKDPLKGRSRKGEFPPWIFLP
jgi:hypothetical protein